MKDRTVQRVRCTECSWSGGRGAGGEALSLPCFRCGSAVRTHGEPYVERRVMAGCVCGWYGVMNLERVGRPCPACSAGTELVRISLSSNGQVLA